MKVEYLAAGSVECPLIRLYGDEPKVVGAIMDALRSVADGPVALHEVRGVEPVGDIKLVAIPGTEDRGIRMGPDGTFTWELRPDSWGRVLGMLAPFAERGHGAPIFQYLSNEGAITLVVSTDGHW